MYQLVLSDQLKFGQETKTDTVIVIEKYKPKFQPDFDWVADITAESVPNWALSYLSTQTYGNGEFVQRILNDSELRKAVKQITADFTNHPEINSELLANNRLNVQKITSKKFYSYFGKNNKRIEKGWERIKKKHGTSHVLGFSKIEYYKNFATLYYEHHCGGLCGSGNIVVFEKKDGNWKILSEINLWMS